MASAWWAYFVTLGVMLIVSLLVGRCVSKQTIWAIFIDKRNTWSLTQFQIVMWTLAVFPVVVAFVVSRATKDPSTAWDFNFPGELWAVLGISIGSTTAAVLIKSQKDDPPGQPMAAGNRVLARDDLMTASFWDIFAYDEGNGALNRVDVTKVQNFFFTLVLVGTFVWNALWLFAKATTPEALTALPGFNQVAVGILGISHAGYLTAKAIPQSGEPTPQPGQDLMMNKL